MNEVVRSEQVAYYGKAVLYKDYRPDGHWDYHLMCGDQLVAADHSRRYLQDIMYQVGKPFPNGYVKEGYRS